MTDTALVVIGLLVLLIAGVAVLLVTRGRDRSGAAGPGVLDREPGVGDDAGAPPQASRAVDTVVLPEQPAPALEPELVSPRRRFAERLGRSRETLARGLGGLLGRGTGDEAAWEELEEAMLAADLGVQTTTELVERLRERARDEKVGDGPALRALLRSELLAVLDPELDRTLALDKPADDGQPAIVLVVGVNGTGKTTTIGKLALALTADGKQTVLAAADTFRAAASEQLAIWGERAGAPVVKQAQGADPAAVAHDGLSSAAARGADVLLVDTAGRLHTKTNLMEELKKIRRVLERAGGQIREVLLVLDATTGQNGLAQARQFTDAVAVTGLVLTKLDGTARGGIVVAVQRELGIPVKLVGLGEGPDDLAPFDPEAFVDAILGDDPSGEGDTG